MALNGKGNPNAKNTIVKRKLSEGGVSDLTDGLMRGAAWKMPSWYRVGADGVIPTEYDIYDEKLGVASKKLAWKFFLGLHVNRSSFDHIKGDICLYIQHKTGAWGPYIAANTAFLWWGEEWNLPENGQRIEEFLHKTLVECGQDPMSQSERMTLSAAIESAMNYYSKIFVNVDTKEAICAQISKTMYEKYGISYADQDKMYDRNGNEVAGYTEDFLGRISMPDTHIITGGQ